MMENLYNRATNHVIVPSLIVVIAGVWLSKVNAVVPEPYLDEFFHVHQAQAYLQGQWGYWNPKITTPPGLYIISYIWISVVNVFGRFPAINASTLRYTNILASGLLAHEIRKVVVLRISSYHDAFKTVKQPDSKLLAKWAMVELNHCVFNICLFPPLFFFYSLYYTDVISALSVLMAYRLHSQSANKAFLLVSLASLSLRQTNIFWVSVFLGGLELCRTLTRGHPGREFPEKPTFFDIMIGSWQHSYIFDPLVGQACLEDYAKSSLSVLVAALSRLPTVLLSLAPHLTILGAFAVLVIWNNGVVLGDKENHVASIHLSQMLYIWPYLMFFSFPLLYPYLLNCIVPQRKLPQTLRSGSSQFPRIPVFLSFTAIMLPVVHYNTIIHPFTLADNRHYMFYVFRLLLRHPLLKYAAVPIYTLCAWAAITSLGGLPNAQEPGPPLSPMRTETKDNHQLRLPPSSSNPAAGSRVSFVLVWFLATALSLITAPLVEPRYFIIPWLLWRIHLPSPRPQPPPSTPSSSSSSSSSNPNTTIRAILYAHHDHRLWLETLWFLALNWATGYVFLRWGFGWPQEPGKVQRFMW